MSREIALLVHDRCLDTLHNLDEAETLLLQLPTDVDVRAIPFIQKSIADAIHIISGMAYAIACLDESIRQQRNGTERKA